MQTWQCLPNCGACCHLDPRDRPDLEMYLSPAELQQYLSMVGEAGWCIHFDHTQRQCQIYDTRPRFCRVTPDTFEQMYAVSPADFDKFAINCCCEQISGVYGQQSEEMQRYTAGVQEEMP
ncbi:MAG: YkgJ family cysteine cluster protein [Spirulina sp. SIO3F2]|nr:YkgJ family cysteine cluster protein [Spirulina sp. SIO3F2]